MKHRLYRERLPRWVGIRRLARRVASPASVEVSLGPAVVSAGSVLLVALGGLLAGYRRFERAGLG